MTQSAETPDFQLLDDVKIALRAQLDERTISFPDLLALDVGSILQLSRPSGENVDLYIGKVLLGSGEILVLDASLAVRMADIGDRHGLHNGEPSSHSPAA